MKTLANIRVSLLLIVTFVICVVVVPGQQTKPAAKPNAWQEVLLDLWQVKFSIPKDLKAIPQDDEDKPDSTTDDYSETLTYSRTKPLASQLKLEIYLRNVKGETIKTENQGKEYNLTPEQLLTLDFIGDSELLSRPDSTVIEARYDEVDQVNGIYVVSNERPNARKTVKPTNDILVFWGTYRLSKGHVQRIMVTLKGKRTQLATMRKIIDSMMFGK